MKYYKYTFENGQTKSHWCDSGTPYLDDDEQVLLDIQGYNLVTRGVLVESIHRQDQLNSRGDINEVQIFPNKEIEQSLLEKKQKHWH